MDTAVITIPSKDHRRSIRLRGYDYAQPGAYFVTICTRRWDCLFGDVVDGRMVLSPFGKIVDACWSSITAIRPHVHVDEFVVMPNHLHGIVMIRHTPENVGATQWVAPTDASSKPRGLAPNSLGTIVGQFKSAATKQINSFRGTPGQPVWQRNYYEHIIREDAALNRLREYIHYNPLRWHLDKYHPAAIEPDEFDAQLNGAQ